MTPTDHPTRRDLARRALALALAAPGLALTSRRAAAAEAIKLGFNGDLSASPSAQSGRAAVVGIEAAIETRNRLPHCKILLFSGQAATADLLEQARMQGHEFEILAKPVHPTDLLAKLRA